MTKRVVLIVAIGASILETDTRDTYPVEQSDASHWSLPIGSPPSRS